MDKEQLREAMHLVPSVTEEQSHLVVAGLFGWISGRLPGTITAFLPMEDEVDLESLFERLPGWRWVLPRVELDNSISFRDRGVEREKHAFGMIQPADVGPNIEISQIDVFLVPGLAYDKTGGRLGRGGGFYDGVLSQKRHDAVAVGVTVAARIVDAVPMSDHDVSVDYVADETGIHSVR